MKKAVSATFDKLDTLLFGDIQEQRIIGWRFHYEFESARLIVALSGSRYYRLGNLDREQDFRVSDHYKNGATRCPFRSYQAMAHLLLQSGLISPLTYDDVCMQLDATRMRLLRSDFLTEALPFPRNTGSSRGVPRAAAGPSPKAAHQKRAGYSPRQDIIRCITPGLLPNRQMAN